MFDFYLGLESLLLGMGYSVVFDNHPLRVKLNELDYPVVVVSHDSAEVLDGCVVLHMSLSLLYVQPEVQAYYTAINASQAICSSYGIRSYVVTPLSHHVPDLNGGLLQLSIKLGMGWLCPPVPKPSDE